MCLLWTVCRRYDKCVRIGGINRDTPEVMVVETFIGPIPGIPTIIALDEAIACPHKAIPSRGIEAIGRKLMHGQGMGIKGSIGFAIFPGFATVETANECTCFNGCIDTASLKWIRCHPAHVTGRGTGWKTPGWSRG